MLKNQIEKKALEVLNSLETLEAPIPIKSIIKSFGIKLSPYDLGEDVSGVLVIDNDNCKIGYNSTESYSRQRFTLAHELGHYILHKNKQQEVFVDNITYMFRKTSSKNKDYKIEMEANQFAAAILMPKSLIEKELEKLDDGFVNDHNLISELSKKFKVSQIAMTYRLNNLGYFYDF
ncbi:ImmA/IrrE family metallo-endopeptidase [Chryseobacterium sp. RG1]|uniref:ImmA/IrrE family metallo-endopeptidase n=1 Tax=Chryseobacterium tagetis TaxID=2801334 RepID=A0ABS7ZZX6_9FLAO|nr:ImmA/IrrE family metallo-endopeptidase [Chryseobacterium tagetis]MCA6067090.1 ImmA/IrrE family metallo-endopeptidase [Chryseobacterium tagetis]